MCEIPESNALNDRTILKAEETMWTTPSVEPRKRFAEPVQRQEMSGYIIRKVVRQSESNKVQQMELTLNTDADSSGSLTGVTSKKLNAFH